MESASVAVGHDHARRAPRPAGGQPELPGGGPVPRDAAFHHLRDHALRSVLHGLLLHPGRGRRRVAGRGRRELPVAIAGVNTAILISLELHDALGAGGRAQREPRRAAGGPAHHAAAGPARSCCIQINEYVHIGFAPVRQRPGHDLLRAHRPARRARVRGPHAARVRHDPRLPRPLHDQGAPGRRDARASTGTSWTSCGSSSTRRSTSSSACSTRSAPSRRRSGSCCGWPGWSP